MRFTTDLLADVTKVSGAIQVRIEAAERHGVARR